jgi:transposase-like protein
MKTPYIVGHLNMKNMENVPFWKWQCAFASQKEVKRLEKENRKLKEELEILKQFHIFLKQNQE